ncbi:GNAT family N-acetyltransferase [Lentibacter sp.]|uniref:GNAT family N-acetyltransferase n=1 Tax=Lentibacter sp. TaxID=2024994 RepID=UPI003F6A03D2
MSEPQFSVRLAQTDADILGAQRLRYRVFVEELGSDGALVDHVHRFERDGFDVHSQHLILVDDARDASAPDHVVGAYRLLDETGADAAGQFYSENEYDLSKLKTSGRRLLELGRSCLDADYRGGSAMFHLWNALAEFVQEREIEILFGVASFHGTDATKLRLPLSLLHYRYCAPEALRVRALEAGYQPMGLMQEEEIDRRGAMMEMPALIKAYLRLGGAVGEGAFTDRAFNTTDVCLIMDTAAMPSRRRSLYQGRK